MDEINLKEYSILLAAVDYLLSAGEWESLRKGELEELKRKLVVKIKGCI